MAGLPVTGRRDGGGRSQHYCGSLDCGLPLVAFWNITRTQNVSECMLVFALCLVVISQSRVVKAKFHYAILLANQLASWFA